MRKLWIALMLGLVLSPVLIFLIVPPANADEPQYNLGVIYGETFPNVKQGATGESTIYFYSAFGNVNCWVTTTADNCPSGWRVEFVPENVTVIPQWFENQAFDVGSGEACLSLSYKDDNGVSKKGWVRAYPIKVRVTVPKNADPDNYPVKISYKGDFRMGGMSPVNRSGSVDWTVEVESGAPIASSNSAVLIILVICAVAVGSIIAIKRIKSKRERS